MVIKIIFSNLIVFLFEEVVAFKLITLYFNPNNKANEKKILDAICILLENPDGIEIFNKKAIYLYMREITGLNTKQVVNSLNKIRQKYKHFKKEWDDGQMQ